MCCYSLGTLETHEYILFNGVTSLSLNQIWRLVRKMVKMGTVLQGPHDRSNGSLMSLCATGCSGHSFKSGGVMGLPNAPSNLLGANLDAQNEPGTTFPSLSKRRIADAIVASPTSTLEVACFASPQMA